MKLIFFLLLLILTIHSSAQTDSTFRIGQSDVIFDIVEEQPEFPGGTVQLYKFISDNFIYPQKCKRKNHQGKIYVSFVVEKDGSIEEVKILRGVDKDLDAEAIRIVKLMPKWKPGKQKGKLVKVRYNLPINCTLT